MAEATENYARFNGPWLQGWNDVSAASIASARIAFGQLELAALTARFMTQRMRAYSDYDGQIKPIARRLDELTEQYGEDYSRELRQIYSAWSDLLRNDRAASQAKVLPTRGAERRDEPWNGKGEAKRGADVKGDSQRREKRGKRRLGKAAH